MPWMKWRKTIDKGEICCGTRFGWVPQICFVCSLQGLETIPVYRLTASDPSWLLVEMWQALRYENNSHAVSGYDFFISSPESIIEVLAAIFLKVLQQCLFPSARLNASSTRRIFSFLKCGKSAREGQQFVRSLLASLRLNGRTLVNARSWLCSAIFARIDSSDNTPDVCRLIASNIIPSSSRTFPGNW